MLGISDALLLFEIRYDYHIAIQIQLNLLRKIHAMCLWVRTKWFNILLSVLVDEFLIYGTLDFSSDTVIYIPTPPPH